MVYFPESEEELCHVKGGFRRLSILDKEQPWDITDQKRNTRLYLRSITFIAAPKDDKNNVLTGTTVLRADHADDFTQFQTALKTVVKYLGGLHLHIKDITRATPFAYEVVKLVNSLPLVTIHNVEDHHMAVKAMKNRIQSSYAIRGLLFPVDSPKAIGWCLQNLNFTRYECRDVKFDFTIDVMKYLYRHCKARTKKSRMVVVLKSEELFFDLDHIMHNLPNPRRCWNSFVCDIRLYFTDFTMRLKIEEDQDQNDRDYYELQLWFIEEWGFSRREEQLYL